MLKENSNRSRIAHGKSKLNQGGETSKRIVEETSGVSHQPKRILRKVKNQISLIGAFVLLIAIALLGVSFNEIRRRGYFDSAEGNEINNNKIGKNNAKRKKNKKIHRETSKDGIDVGFEDDKSSMIKKNKPFRYRENSYLMTQFRKEVMRIIGNGESGNRSVHHVRDKKNPRANSENGGGRLLVADTGSNSNIDGDLMRPHSINRLGGDDTDEYLSEATLASSSLSTPTFEWLKDLDNFIIDVKQSLYYKIARKRHPHSATNVTANIAVDPVKILEREDHNDHPSDGRHRSDDKQEDSRNRNSGKSNSFDCNLLKTEFGIDCKIRRPAVSAESTNDILQQDGHDGGGNDDDDDGYLVVPGLADPSTVFLAFVNEQRRINYYNSEGRSAAGQEKEEEVKRNMKLDEGTQSLNDRFPPNFPLFPLAGIEAFAEKDLTRVKNDHSSSSSTSDSLLPRRFRMDVVYTYVDGAEESLKRDLALFEMQRFQQRQQQAPPAHKPSEKMKTQLLTSFRRELFTDSEQNPLSSDSITTDVKEANNEHGKMKQGIMSGLLVVWEAMLREMPQLAALTEQLEEMEDQDGEAEAKAEVNEGGFDEGKTTVQDQRNRVIDEEERVSSSAFGSPPSFSSRQSLHDTYHDFLLAPPPLTAGSDLRIIKREEGEGGNGWGRKRGNPNNEGKGKQAQLDEKFKVLNQLRHGKGNRKEGEKKKSVRRALLQTARGGPSHSSSSVPEEEATIKTSGFPPPNHRHLLRQRLLEQTVSYFKRFKGEEAEKSKQASLPSASSVSASSSLTDHEALHLFASSIAEGAGSSQQSNRYRDFGEFKHSLRGLYRHIVKPATMMMMTTKMSAKKTSNNTRGVRRPNTTTSFTGVKYSNSFGVVYIVVSNRKQIPPWLHQGGNNSNLFLLKDWVAMSELEREHARLKRGVSVVTGTSERLSNPLSPIVIVEHKDIFIPDHNDEGHSDSSRRPYYLPNFNSNAIETVLHRIPTLSRFYLYLNNDNVISRPPSFFDFFQPVVVETSVPLPSSPSSGSVRAEVRFVPHNHVGFVIPAQCSEREGYYSHRFDDDYDRGGTKKEDTTHHSGNGINKDQIGMERRGGSKKSRNVTMLCIPRGIRLSDQEHLLHNVLLLSRGVFNNNNQNTNNKNGSDASETETAAGGRDRASPDEKSHEVKRIIHNDKDDDVVITIVPPPPFILTNAHFPIVFDKLRVLQMLTEPSLIKPIEATRQSQKRHKNNFLLAYSYSYYSLWKRFGHNLTAAWGAISDAMTMSKTILSESEIHHHKSLQKRKRRAASLWHFMSEQSSISADNIDVLVKSRKNKMEDNTTIIKVSDDVLDDDPERRRSQDPKSASLRVLGILSKLAPLVETTTVLARGGGGKGGKAHSTVSIEFPSVEKDLIAMRDDVDPGADFSTTARENDALRTRLQLSTFFYEALSRSSSSASFEKRDTTLIKVHKPSHAFGTTMHWLLDAIVALVTPAYSQEASPRYYFGMMRNRVQGLEYLKDVMPRLSDPIASESEEGGEIERRDTKNDPTMKRKTRMMGGTGTVLSAVFNDDLPQVRTTPSPFLQNISYLAIRSACFGLSDMRLTQYIHHGRGRFEAIAKKYIPFAAFLTIKRNEKSNEDRNADDGHRNPSSHSASFPSPLPFFNVSLESEFALYSLIERDTKTNKKIVVSPSELCEEKLDSSRRGQNQNEEGGDSKTDFACENDGITLPQPESKREDSEENEEFDPSPFVYAIFERFKGMCKIVSAQTALQFAMEQAFNKVTNDHQSHRVDVDEVYSVYASEYLVEAFKLASGGPPYSPFREVVPPWEREEGQTSQG